MDDERGTVVKLCEALGALAGLAYLCLTVYNSYDHVVPLRARVYFHGGVACATAAGLCWDGALWLRHAYRREIEL